MKTEYIVFGLSLSEGQKVTLAKAARSGIGAMIQPTHGELCGVDNLGLIKHQDAHIMKKIAEGGGVEPRFTKTQLKRMKKMGSILPLLAQLPVISGGLSAVVVLAGGPTGLTKAVQSKWANVTALAEAKRLRCEVKAQLRGSGLYLGHETCGGCCPMCKGSGLYLTQKITHLTKFDKE